MKKTIVTLLLTVSLIGTSVTAKSLKNPVVSSQSVGSSATASASGSANTIWLVMAMAVILFVVASNAQQSMYLTSDERLKTDVKRVGTAANGLPLYHFRYQGHPQMFRGVMAQDVAKHTPKAVIRMDNGYLAVNYAMIGLEMQLVR